MREVSIGTKKYSKVVCLDEPGAGGACHKYQVRSVGESEDGSGMSSAVFAEVDFQNGPIKEAGVNGCHQEDLLAIAIDRLQHFQKGDFACRQNALALTKCEEAPHWLSERSNK